MIAGAGGGGVVLSSHPCCGLLCKALSGVCVCSLAPGVLGFGGFRPQVLLQITLCEFNFGFLVKLLPCQMNLKITLKV